MQPERKYRNILPGPPVSSNQRNLDDNGEAVSWPGGGQEGVKRKRRATTKACNSCREKKIGCNGLHPCSHCQRRGLACEYTAISKTILNSIPTGMKLLDETTAKSHQYAAELLGILRSLSDDQVGDVLQQLRSGKDASNIVSALRGQLHSAYDLPFHGILHGVPPPDQNSLEFELMVRHAIAYSPWAPTELSHMDFELSSKPSQNLSFDTPSTGVSPMSRDSPSPLRPVESESSFSGRIWSTPRDSSRSLSLSHGSQSKFGSRETGLADVPPLCDERLQKLDILAWSNVPVPNEAAKGALSLYLETEHSITALFDADLFLDDLISGSTRFCSRLLVSSLCSWAFQAYTAFDSEATAWSHMFYEEATERLSQEMSLGLSSPSTVAALVYLSMASTCHAKNTTDASNHLESAVDLAKSMGLFGIAGEEAAGSWADGSPDAQWEKAMAQTAWGSFVYITTQCAHNQTCKIPHPPRAPIPGDENESDTLDFPERQPSSAFKGGIFPFLCRLALIAHDMVWMNYAGSSLGSTAHSRVEPMESVYQRYLGWADGLPTELVRSGESPHHVLLLHIYLHAFVLDLFRPLVRHGDAMRVKLESFTSRQASPEAVCSASITQLKRIAITYLQTCSSASYCFSWQTALLYVANAALRESPHALELSERRSDLRTCIMGYQKLQRCFRLPQGVIRGLLSMALREGLITSPEARAMIRDSEERGKHHQSSEQVLAPFVVDLDLAMVDPEAALVDRLAAEFDDLAILNEFTVVNTAQEPPDLSMETMGSDLDV
ncbi:Activator of stress genes 3 [Colletotrichum plurivorum]|uniref:Activator of stress genes 3 n=1 Tax=Colletotrichum plurivorum TaxID=2175906 RepID=A0A8H6KF91_9PEZI|nr:Activator of stress genes 3 [Colletotrichum plurivorum]